MNSMAMRKCSRTVSVVFVVCLAFAAHGSTNVFDDAVFWFRGGKDIGGDGYLRQQGEFFDDLHANDPTHDYHKMTVPSYSGSYDAFKVNAEFRKEQVVFPALGTSVAENMQFIHLSDVVVKSSNTDYYFPFSVNPRRIFEDNNISKEYTIVSRIRIGDLDATNCLFSIGYSDSATNGMWIGFVKHPTYASCKYIRGARSPASGSKVSSYSLDMRIPTNTWVDVAVVVGNGKLRVGVAAPTSYSENYPSIAFGETPMWTDNCELLDETNYSLFCYKSLTAPSLKDQIFFHGDVQQVAIWGRILSDQEVMEAFGMPRPAIFRTGLDNGTSNEFGGTRSVATQEIKGLGSWQSVVNTMLAGDTWTVKFDALRDEAGLAQVFSVKTLGDSVTARIEPTLNGISLGQRRIAAGAHVFWPVATNLVVEGENTLVLKRMDTGSGVFGLDAMELGGSLGVGTAVHVINDGRVYPEQIANGVPSSADPNPAHWPVGIRPYYNSNTNFIFNVWVDPEIVGACTSRFWTCAQCKMAPGASSVSKSSHFTIFVNEEAMTNIYADSSWVDIPLDFNPGDLDAGWNKFEIRSAAAYQTCYWLIDRFRFETVLPEGYGVPPLEGLSVIIR